jgi:branched-chain amino acid transport system substrate-binding protein
MTHKMNDIPIGSMVPLSGASAADGREFRNGLTLAIEEVNALGGIHGSQLRPVFVDTHNQSATEVVAAARELINTGFTPSSMATTSAPRMRNMSQSLTRA